MIIMKDPLKKVEDTYAKYIDAIEDFKNRALSLDKEDDLINNFAPDENNEDIQKIDSKNFKSTENKIRKMLADGLSIDKIKKMRF